MLGFSQIDVAMVSAPPEPKRLRRYLGSKRWEATRNHRLAKSRTFLGGTFDETLDQLTLWKLREISEDLYRNNGLCRGILDRAVENIVGPEGFNYCPRTGDKGLNRELESFVNDWSENHADRAGRMNLAGITRALTHLKFLHGDALLFLDDVGRAGSGSLVGIEANRCVTPDVDGDWVNGIRLSRHGEPTAYFIADNVPSSAYVSEADGRAYPAAQVIHYAAFNRFTQTRGVPLFASSVRDCDDLDALLVSTRVAAKIAAMNSFVVTKNVDPAEFAEALANRDPDEQDSTDVVPRIELLEPGEVNYLAPGEDMYSVGSEHPSEHFEAFVELLVRFIGIPAGLPLELTLLNFSNTNFSASRLSLDQAKRSFRCHQAELRRLLSKVIRWAIGIGVREGMLPDRPEVMKHDWISPGWPYMDPLKDARADFDLLKARLTSRTEIKARRGEDFSLTLDNLEREAEEMADRGLATDDEPSTPRSTATVNVPQ